MATNDDVVIRKLTPILLVVAIIFSIIALVSAMQANNRVNEAINKLNTHHHSSTTSGTEIKEKPSDTGQPNLMRGTGQPPTQP